MLNILDLTTGQVMLGDNVKSYKDAYYWLDYYRHNYSAGVPFPDGKGVYDGAFVICREVEDAKDNYRVLQ